MIGIMAKKRFTLIASVSTNSPEVIRTVLERLMSKGCVTQTIKKEFRIETEMVGENSKGLNRLLLSELRRAERKTRLRAEWTSGDTVERFFDYAWKKTTKTAK